MRAEEILQRLHDSEIDYAISTCWQGGFDWQLLDQDMNPCAEGGAESLSEAAAALAEATLAAYPESDFALWWRANRGEGPLEPSIGNPCPLCGIPVLAMVSHGELWRFEHTEGGPCRGRRGLKAWERLPIAALS